MILFPLSFNNIVCDTSSHHHQQLESQTKQANKHEIDFNSQHNFETTQSIALVWNSYLWASIVFLETLSSNYQEQETRTKQANKYMNLKLLNLYYSNSALVWYSFLLASTQDQTSKQTWSSLTLKLLNHYYSNSALAWYSFLWASTISRVTPVHIIIVIIKQNLVALNSLFPNPLLCSMLCYTVYVHTASSNHSKKNHENTAAKFYILLH